MDISAATTVGSKRSTACRWLLFAAAFIGAAAFSAPAWAAAQFPLHLSANGRYLVDSSSAQAPFLVVGDAPWGISRWVSTKPNSSNPGGQSDAAYLLQSEVDHGINTVVTWLVTGDNGSNWNGHAPFTSAGNIASVNDAYFTDFKAVLDLAKAKGLLVVINPIWERLWATAFSNATTTQMQSYGAYLARKYPEATYPNVIWMLGGDGLAQTAKEYALAQGIASVNTHAIITGHGTFGAGNYTGQFFQPASSYPLINLDAVYNYFPGSPEQPSSTTYPWSYQTSQKAYASGAAHFFVEGEYEDHQAGASSSRDSYAVRRDPWWSLLSGSTGSVYGSQSWNYAGDPSQPNRWKTDMATYPGFNQMHLLTSILGRFPWYSLVPDFAHTYVTAGGGTIGAKDRVTDARTSDGRLFIAYLPPTGTASRSLTVAGNTMSGSYTATWFDPTNGSSRAIATGIATGTARSFTTPGANAGGRLNDNDWVLVLQAGAVAQVPVTTTTLPYSDNFEKGTAAWTPRTGTWSAVADGTTRYQGSGQCALATAGSTTWGDYSLEATLKLVSTTDRPQLALTARVRDASHYYWFGFENGYWRIWKNNGGSWTLLASKAGTVTTGSDYLVRATVVGSSLALSVNNGTVALTATDAAYATGAIGVWADTGTTARFDNVQATAPTLSGAPPATTTSSLFSDSFESGVAAWTPSTGTWGATAVSGGTRYQGTGATALSTAGSTSWRDYSLRATLSLVSTTDRPQLGVAARVVDASHYYWFGFENGYWRIWKNNGGSWTLLASKAGTVTAGSDYLVKATVTGSSLALDVNGGVVTVAASDATFVAGAVGLWVDTGTTARFDDVSVA